jgi:hypothetical protein
MFVFSLTDTVVNLL